MNEHTDVEGLSAVSWLLELSSAQIGDALNEANQSMDTLTGSVTELMEAVRQIDQHAQIRIAFDNLAEGAPSVQLDGPMVDYVQKVVTALQFYDRLSQRLHHVGEGLDGLARLTRQPDQLNAREPWQGLLQQVTQRHSTSGEWALFQRHLDGAPLDYAVTPGASEDDDGVELF